MWDDDVNIYGNPHLAELTLKSLKWMFTDASYIRRYVPFTWLGWGFNYQAFGLAPWSYHLGNVLLHSLNAYLIFLLSRRLFELALNPSNKSDQIPQLSLCAAFAALLWAMHPFRTEVVSWASGRIYGQAGFFFLLSLLCYLRSASVQRSGWIFYGLSLFFYASSLLSYPIGLFLFWVVFLLDVYPLKRLKLDHSIFTAQVQRRMLLQKIPFLLLAVLAGAVTLLASIHATDFWQSMPTEEGFGFMHRLMQGFYIWARYLWKSIVPFSLSPAYTTLIRFDPLAFPFLFSFLVVVSITIFLGWRRGRTPALWIGWLCYLGLLIPLLGFSEHPYSPSDRYAYLAHLPLAVLAGAGIFRFLQQGRFTKTALALSILLLSALSVLSFRQAGIWQNSETLFETMIRRVGDHPYRGELHWRLGDYFASVHRTLPALAEYDEAIKVLPWFGLARERKGDVLVADGQLQKAEVEYDEALRRNPRSLTLYLKSGATLTQLGRLEEASAVYRRGIANFQAPALKNNLAWLLATSEAPELRNGGEAISLAEQACEATAFNNPIFIGTLAAAYAEAGRFPEAVQTAGRAAKVARQQGSASLAQKNDELAEFYKSGKPVRDKPSTPQ
jgi:tetratricopeptide (TPR) repeat protein